MYLIAYRLHKVGKDYNALYKAIQGLSGTYWHNTTSSWLVESSLSAREVFTRLKPSIDENDELAVFKLHGAYYGFLQQSDHDWLAARGGMHLSS